METKRSSFDKTYKLLLFLMPLVIGLVLMSIQITYESRASQEKIQAEVTDYKEHIKIRIMDEVYSAVFLANHYYLHHQEDYTPEEIKTQIVTMLEGLHSDDVGYYFSANYSGTTMIGPAKGENVYNIEDINGFKVVQNLITTAQAGGGFVEYVMPAIEGYDQVEKLSFVLPFEPYDWYIGAGVLLEEIALIEDNIRRQTKEKNRNIFLLMGMSILSLMVILSFINNMIYSYIKSQIERLKNFLVADPKAPKPDFSDIRIQELADIGSHVQALIQERDDAQNALSHQLNALRVTSNNLEETNAALEEEIQEHEYARLRLEVSEKRFETMVHALPDAFFIINKKGIFVDCEISDPQWLLYKKEDFIGQSIEKILPSQIGKIALEKIHTTLETKKTQFLEYSLENDGTKYYEARFVYNASTEVFAIVRDVSPLKLAQVKNYYLKYCDALTKLYNRRYFEEQLILLDQKTFYPLGILMIQINGLKLINDAFGHDVGDNLIKWGAAILEKEGQGAACLARLGGDEFIVLYKNTSYQALEDLAKNIKAQAQKTLFHHTVLSFSVGIAIKNKASENIQEMIRLAETVMHQEKVKDSRFMKEKTVEQILDHLNRKIPSEEIHAKRVGEISRALGQALALDQLSTEDFYHAGRLHDIGKITIDHELLNKSTLLTDKEWLDIKSHPQGSYKILKTIEPYAHLAKGILHHHERYDGKGYPDNLKGRAIPLISRVIAIADAFEAMTSHRPYRNKVSFYEAMVELKNKAGTQFDPDLVEIFEHHIYKKMDKL